MGVKASQILSYLEDCSLEQLREIASFCEDPNDLLAIKDFILEKQKRNRKKKASSSLLNFTCYTKPDYQVSWSNEIIASELDAILQPDCDYDRLIIQAPPRTGKSEIASRRFPAYAFGKNPTMNIIATSYASDLAQRMNRDVQRIIDSPEYRELFPNTRLNSANVKSSARGSYIRTSDLFEIVDHKGAYRSAGVGGSITGMGADCVLGGTLISTTHGDIPVEIVASNPDAHRVWGYNHETRIFEQKRVQASRTLRSSKPIVEIQTASGRILRCTSDHRIFTKEEGYISAGSVRADRHTIITTKNLRILSFKDGQEIDCVPDVLHPVKKSGNTPKLHPVCEEIHQTLLRDQQGHYQGTIRRLLFPFLFGKASCVKKFKNILLQNMFQPVQSKKRSQALLFNRVYRTKKTRTPNDILRNLQQGFSTPLKADNVLRNEMRFSGTFKKNARLFKLTLQDGALIQPIVCGNSKSDIREGRACLSDMWFNGQGASTPRRSRTEKQLSGKFDNALYDVSYSTPQVIYESISSVKVTSGEENQVYDLQIEGTNNFLAGEILVHNCLLIDDYLKDWTEATSKRVKDGVWEWYNSTAYTRLSPEGKVVIIATRWADDDLIGRLLKAAKEDKKADQWRVVSLPMEYDSSSEFAHELDPRSEDGELLFPERFNQRYVERRKFSLPPKIYVSLYQQKPTVDGGNIFKRSDFKFYKEVPELEYKMLSLDATFTDTAKSDFVAFGIWGISGKNKYLLEAKKERLNFTGTLQNIYTYIAKHPELAELIIEAKANGEAIINMLDSDPRIKIPIHAYKPTDSKEARAWSVTPQVSAGQVWLPDVVAERNEGAVWVEDYLNELTTFPGAKYDDYVDMTTQFLIRVAHTHTGWLESVLRAQELDGQKEFNQIAALMGWQTNNNFNLGF